MWNKPTQDLSTQEIPKHKKKKIKKPPKKSNHKHDYEPVLLLYEYSSHNYATGRPTTVEKVSHGSRCRICEKINWGWTVEQSYADFLLTPEEMFSKYPDLPKVKTKCPWRN